MTQEQQNDIANLRAALKAVMLSRPRRTVMQGLWIRADRKASLALEEPVRLADVAKAAKPIPSPGGDATPRSLRGVCAPRG